MSGFNATKAGHNLDSTEQEKRAARCERAGWGFSGERNGIEIERVKCKRHDGRGQFGNEHWHIALHGREFGARAMYTLKVGEHGVVIFVLVMVIVATIDFKADVRTGQAKIEVRSPLPDQYGQC